MQVGRQFLAGRVLARGRILQRAPDAGGVGRPQSRSFRVPATDNDAPEVPEVGWMWQTGGGGANKPGATRANLKAANIKAKKWAAGWGRALGLAGESCGPAAAGGRRPAGHTARR
jgi:hypothetical protein